MNIEKCNLVWGKMMFEMQILLLCLITVGFLTAKFNIVDSNSRASLTELILNVFLPCTILASFLGTDRSEILSLGILVIISLFTLAFSLGMAYLLFRKNKPEVRKVLFYAMLIPNASFLGFPLIEGIYGMGGLSYAAAYLIPLRAAIWSGGQTIFTGGKGDLKKVIFHPSMIATYTGIIFMLTGFSPPKLIHTLSEILGSCTTPLSMMVVGCVLGQIKIKNLLSPIIFYYSFIRLIIMPLLIFGILYFFRFMPIITGISVILAGTPAGVTTAILAEKYGSDSELASKLVFVSTILSMITIPILVMLIG